MSDIQALTKISFRTKRSACEGCGSTGPFYDAQDQNGNVHRITANSLSQNIPQGGQVPLHFLHVCPGQATQAQAGESQSTAGTANGVVVDEDTARKAQLMAEAEEAKAQAQGAKGQDPKLAALFAMMEELFSRPSLDEGQIKAIIKEMMDEYVYPTRTYVVAANETREIEGTTHKDFGKVLKAIAARRNVQLVGAPGVGKTHMCAQVAEALGREFYAINFHLQSTASELKGYMDATGNFVPTVVYDWATNPNGGILLCDELDRAHAGILAALNSILSNRFITLPNRETVHLTDNHVILAATNTYGDGPTWEYPAAQKFSAEFKDRFIAMTIDIDTDIELAAAMAEGAPVDVTRRAVAYVQRVRENVKREAINGVVVSPRASQNMAALLAQDVDWEDAVAWTLRKGMDEDTWRKVA
ncbi:hypothetical protein SEA_CALM_136 [Mycobacterium phage Calm]|nr:AAA-ATPase [Mycobacterium phage Zaria]WMI34713.1 hypothetical protein SEA_CALM_136 [Mycobacterium phage Calm]